MESLLQLILLLALIICASGLRQCEESFAACLIKTLEFDIPDTTSTIGFETFRIRNLKCDQGEIGGLESSYISPMSINGALTDVKLHCDGSYSYGALGGRLYAAISISSLLVDTTMTTSTISQYPAALSASSCSLSSFAIKLSFTGGITGSILNLISPLVESLIIDNFKSIACSKLSQLVSVDGTKMLVDRMDPMIRRLIELGQPDSEYPNEGVSIVGYVHWADSVVSAANSFIFDDYSGRVGQCFFGDSGDDLFTPSRIGTVALSTTKAQTFTSNFRKHNSQPVPMVSIISYYTNGTGKFSTLLGSEAILPVPSPVTPNSIIQFTEVSVSGLETLRVLDVMRPSMNSNISMSNSFLIDHLEIKLYFSFCSDINNKQVCDNKNSSVIANLSNITVEMNCSVGAIQKILNTLHLDELTSIPFWLSTIDFFNITALTLHPTVDSIVIRGANSGSQDTHKGLQTSDLDSGISYLIDNAFKLLVSSYTDLVDAVISASVQGPVRHTINLAINDMLRRHKNISTQHVDSHAESRSIGKKGDNLIIKWAEFPPLVLFRDVADAVSADDLNRFIECLVSKGQDQGEGMEDLSKGGHARHNFREEALVQYRHREMDTLTRSSGQLSSQSEDSRMRVTGLNSLFDISILAPYPSEGPTPYNLKTSVGLGTCNNDVCRPLDLRYTQPSNRSVISVKDSSSVGSVSVLLENLDLQLEVLLELTMGTYRSLQVSQLGQPGCLLSIFQKVAIETLALQVSQAAISIGLEAAVGRYGEEDWETETEDRRTLLESKTLDVTKSIQKLFKMLGQQGTIQQLNKILTQYSLYSKDLCAGYAPVKPRVAAHHLDNNLRERENSDWTASMSIIGACVVFCLIFLLLVARYYKGRNPSIRASDTSYSLMHGSFNDFDVEMRSKEERRTSIGAIDEIHSGRAHRITLRNMISPLYLHTDLSLFVRFFLPLGIVGNIALFLYSNRCMNAVAVLITLSSGAFTSIPEPLLAFGLLGTIVSMWEAKVYLLAILVAFLSGLWPYIKLLCLLFCWIAPPPLPTGLRLTQQKSFPFYGFSMATERRYEMLRTVEILGKWGLLDFYVMVLMMCAFHLNLEVSQSNGPTSIGPILVEVLVQPNFGFFSFLLATMASHALSHIMLACHRHAVPITPVTFDVPISNVNDGHSTDPTIESRFQTKKLRLMDVRFLVPRQCCLHTAKSQSVVEGSTVEFRDDCDLEEDLLYSQYTTSPSSHVIVQFTILGKRAIIGHILIFMIGIIVATSMFSFSFEFKGLVGWMLERQGHGKNIVAYSFDSVGSRMQEAAGLVKSSGPVVPGLKPQIICMQICYFAFGLFAPLLQLLLLLCIWLVPLSPSGLASAQLMADTVGAWTAVDVFCLSIAAALLEIRQFAAFIVGDHCTDIDSIAAYFVPMKAGQDMKCFDVVTTLSMVRCVDSIFQSRLILKIYLSFYLYLIFEFF